MKKQRKTITHNPREDDRSMPDDIILVDELDRQIGTAEKMAAHRSGRLHRAFSILIFNTQGEMLIQKRARGKYHSGGLWTNACCSHPRAGAYILPEANRRLFEEMGIQCELEEIFSFIYRAEFENGLVENEFDHVFWGTTDADPRLNPEEAEDWRRLGLENLRAEIATNPEHFTPWFRIIIEKLATVAAQKLDKSSGRNDRRLPIFQ